VLSVSSSSFREVREHAMTLNSTRVFTPDAGSPAASAGEIEEGSDSFESSTSHLPLEKPQASWLQDALVDTFEDMGKHVEERFANVEGQVHDDGAGIAILEAATTSVQKVCAEVKEIAHSGSQSNVPQLGSKLASMKAEQAKLKASATVRSTQKVASYEQRAVTSVGNSGWNHAPTLLEGTRDVFKEAGVNASQKLGPTTRGIIAGNVPQGTWKQSAGRTHGPDGYELGDLTRGWVQRASKRLQERFGISQQKEKLKNGDASFMSQASCVPASMDNKSHMPSSFDSVHEGTIQDILARMLMSRTTAKRLLEKSLPLLELRLQELTAGHALDTQDKYDLYRIHSGNLLLRDPLQKYRKGLESVRSHCDIVFDSKFVQEAQKTGVLQEFLELLDDNMMLADQGASCVNEVYEGASIIF